MDLDALERLPGNSVRRVAPHVAIGCIRPEARELLDRAMAEWRPFIARVNEQSRDLPDWRMRDADEAYLPFYWLFRWSGLIDPMAQAAALQAREQTERERKEQT